MAVITKRALRRLKIGKSVSEALHPYGSGSLQARRTLAGVRFYYRFGSNQQRIPLTGCHKQPLGLADAREKAGQLADQVRNNPGPDLGSLLMNYCDILSTFRRSSAKQTRALLCRHVKHVAMDIWRKPANSIRPDDILKLLDPLVKANKIPTAIQLRSVLRAAFQMAWTAHLNAQAQSLRQFNITYNPVSDVQPIQKSSTPSHRALSLDELRALWTYLKTMEAPIGPALRLFILTGAQRVTQFLRATQNDLTPEGLLLYDSKGRRSCPREHLVPLTAPARAEINRIENGGPYFFSHDNGRSPLHRSTLHSHITKIALMMIVDGHSPSPFCLADLRRTVETRLAASGIPSDVRAQLQSHGLGGIQNRHYDRHDYLTEKRQALEKLYELVVITPRDSTNIVSFPTTRTQPIQPGKQPPGGSTHNFGKLRPHTRPQYQPAPTSCNQQTPSCGAKLVGLAKPEADEKTKDAAVALRPSNHNSGE